MFYQPTFCCFVRGASLRCHAKARSASTAVFAVGEGWTGALGTGRLDQSIAGHDDATSDAVDSPVIMYTSDQHRIQSCSVGWGHTAMVVEEIQANQSTTSTTGSNTDNAQQSTPPTIGALDVHRRPTRTQLLLTGRPHDFSALLRLQRLPRRLRQYAVHQTFRSVNHHNDKESDKNQSFHPVDLVDRLVTYLSTMVHTKEDHDWDEARRHSFMAVPTAIDLPESPLQVTCSAGITAVTTESGAVYSFGLNGMGQCGIGHTSNNVWKPTALTGLSRDFASGLRSDMPQSFPIEHIALGLQHGLALNSNGEMFSWGKGERGQLGHDAVESESHTAMPILKAVSLEQMVEAVDMASGYAGNTRPKPPKLQRLGRISQISAGMIHSAALEAETNQVFLWGKNILPLLPDDRSSDAGKHASDARMPVLLSGLHENRTVLKVSCGSHHTSILLDDGSVWAVGVASDTKLPVHTPVCLFEPGIVDLSSMTQFTAHMDRTTIVFDEGRQVLQAHLWSNIDNQKAAIFTPAWFDKLLEDDADWRIREVHRSWLHTVVVGEKS